MILPVLLIPLPDVKKYKKYLYNPETVNQQQGLVRQIRTFIQEIYYQFFGLPLIATTPINIQYLHNWQQSNYHQPWEHHDQYDHVLACNEQKSQQWFQKMSPSEKQEILKQLKSDYRSILIDYFITDKNLKIAIDKFINALFYANIPVPQIIEIHMDLIDEFSKQLKLEGRSDETLLDYRLTLIDILAHLCEVYRCSSSKIT
ncbi:KaiA family protein [Anabaena sp. UHCC 0451]|uniref:KaiA family protein n=1 Tax=Anabaena sp. UHCC 0451 TaxID=2055235 RepID=UPI002B1FA2BD|nr:KaiA family protein [Anabaena sp. UHCC 0451]MEA5577406.1 KaiA family protein [Anabaena sp. UHCC 0451]